MEIELQEETRLRTSPATTLDLAPNTVQLRQIKMGQTRRLMLLLLSVLLVIIGCAGGPLLLRLYFLHGGNRKWFVNFLQTAGFPFLFLPLLYSFFSRRCENPQKRHKLFQLTPPLLVYSTFLGLITGIGNLLGSYGISYLPVSTASLLGSTQLGFTAVFAFFIVRQKFTAPSINAVVLLSFGAVVLGVDADSDRPEGESKGKYYVGFAVMLAAAVLYALSLPILELMFMKTKQDVTYVLLLEIQFIIGLSATVFCAVGMAVNKDFQAISREGELYGLGETKYYAMVVFIAIIAQIFSVGLVATINYSSALLGGIVIAACIPLAEVLAVFLLHEKFDGEKGVALALSLWGTASYFYGQYKDYQRGKTIAVEMDRCQDRLPVSVTDSDSFGGSQSSLIKQQKNYGDDRTG